MDNNSGYSMVWLDRQLTDDKIQHTLGKFQVVTPIFWRLHAVIKMVPDVTFIEDDILAKGNSGTNHDIAVLNLTEMAINNNLKFNPDNIQLKTESANF